MMQHRTVVGSPIANFYGDRFEDRMKRISASLLDEIGLVMVNCRMNGGRAPWFALRVWTGKEKAVESSLEQLGICSLVPMRKGPDLRRRHRVIEGTMMPVIHGYVLVQLIAKAEYLAGLLGVEHAISVLGGCDRPMRVREAEVKRFNDLAASGAYDSQRSVAISVRAGERVRLGDGPFRGFGAVVVTPNRKEHGDVVVTVRIMGGEVPMTVPLAMLEKL